MPVVPTTPATSDPDDHDPVNDCVTDDQLHDLDIDPDAISILAPHATEYRARDGSRCWSRADLAELLDAEGEQR